MPLKRILVDSNAYFRLAKSIRPLLGAPFGSQEYCLFVLKELQLEYDRSPRLKDVFHWVNEPEYKENRAYVLEISKEEKPEIKRAYEFILDYVRNVHPGVSKVDVLCLAHAEQLGIPVVTDDEEMREAAGDYGIKTLNTLELLRLMLDAGHIDMPKVREIVGYLAYQRDMPKKILKDYKRIFAEDPPK
jgi:predicted nucleic acid-binding protein